MLVNIVRKIKISRRILVNTAIITINIIKGKINTSRFFSYASS